MIGTDILGLDVAVDHARGVNVVQARSDLIQQLYERSIGCDLADVIAEIMAIVGEKSAPAAKPARAVGVTVRTAPADAPGETEEINVIGCTVEEPGRLRGFWSS